MSQIQTQSHQEDLVALLKVLSGEVSDDPIAVTQDFISKHPEQSEGYFILGVLTYLSGYVGDAISMIEKAHELDPDVREYAQALSSLYTKSDRLNDALYFAKLGVVLASHPQMAGILPPDLKNFVETAEHELIHSHYVTALVAFDQREFEKVISECELELKMDSSYVPALDLYARTLIEMGDYGYAVPVLQRVLQLKPNNVDYCLSLADALSHLGFFEQARDYIEKALQGAPGDLKVGVRAFYLLSLMPKAEQVRGAVWETLTQAGLTNEEPYFPYTPSSDGKIRIGFLSDKCYDCFEGSVLSHLLERFDKNLLEGHVYIQNINHDGVTQAIKNWADSSRPVYDVNDKTLALIMQRDQIDILIDMCGAGQNQRLAFVAHQPCGLRLSWLAPLHGGGLPGINFVVTDGSTDSAQARFLRAQQANLRLNGPVFARKPVRGYGDPSPPPVQSKGYVTFGAYLDFRALSDRDGALWVRLLTEVDNAKLRLHIGARISEIGLARLNEIFEPVGLLERIELYTPDEDERLGGFFDHVDIFLAAKTEKIDSIIKALWMGVPCLTRPDDEISYVTYSGAVLRAAGIPSWACEDDDAFLTVAKSLASNHGELAGLRNALRPQCAQSALMNVDSFALDFQGKLAEMFFTKIQKR
ncbi:tetratricopeptide repeat protein [Magnetovibrio sp.]|uniref:tetratricopeptide repeat protein n=1 Tax=Magnetovibrio sp. TaxID=2024836 RepID=UPI002F934C5D